MLNNIKNEIAIWLSHFFFVHLQCDEISKYDTKELLLKDLSARLPYGVYISPVDCGKAILIGIKDGNPLLWDTIHKKEYDKPWDIEYIKPYLRPLSSMTEEEKDTYDTLTMCNAPWVVNDWLGEKMFAYRTIDDKDMFELDLAVEAPEGMYK